MREERVRRPVPVVDRGDERADLVFAAAAERDDGQGDREVRPSNLSPPAKPKPKQSTASGARGSDSYATRLLRRLWQQMRVLLQQI